MSYLAGKFRQCGVVRIGFGSIVGIAVFAMFLATVLIPGYDARSARRIDYESETFQSPAQHPPLGTDSLGRDVLKLLVEVQEQFFSDEIRELEALRKRITASIQGTLGISAEVKLVEPKTIERTAGKAKRVIDNRKI